MLRRLFIVDPTSRDETSDEVEVGGGEGRSRSTRPVDVRCPFLLDEKD